ncbi:MAG TPA: hypothetical protein DCL95_18635, partial [Rhodospirillaceae bacterium]|nr:hypothetical protein [Rhodospirillaceae bacterium]
MASPPTLSVIIPTRNAALPLARLLPQLNTARLDLDVIVSDGGSQDDSVEIAARHQARITQAEG